MLFLPLKPSMVSIALKIELAIFEVTDIKLDLAVQPPATHLLTHHSAGTLSPVSHKHHSVLPWGLCTAFHVPERPPTLCWPNHIHPVCHSPKVTLRGFSDLEFSAHSAQSFPLNAHCYL